MDVINISDRRELCWDEYLIDRAKGVSVRMHRPEYRGNALTCSMPWEGNMSGYFNVVVDGRKIRLYYRGANICIDSDGQYYGDSRSCKGPMCYAESSDGKTFLRPDLGIADWMGRAENNIFISDPIDNLCVFKDENPECRPDERFKGLAGIHQTLVMYKSADGVHFEKVGPILSDGSYDSMNLAFWDKTRQQYFIYYRGIHRRNETESDGKWHHGDTGGGKDIVRDVRVRTSKDFKTWDEPRLIEFDADKEDYQLYTNQVKPYYRAPHVFLGMPTRYVERLEDKENFRYLPERKFRSALTRLEGRCGYAMTDAVLMTSRDGYHFRRTDEVFLSPGPEAPGTWFYGDCYPAWGMVETESDRPGFPRELSIYCQDFYRARDVQLNRYAIRIDGFFSWSCGYRPGHVLTKPVTFQGAELEINFATSALGYVRITLCDENGSEIPGFDSGRLFGDSLDRHVDFDGDLRTLAGRPVRLKIEMSDAELYSFRSLSECPI